MSKIIAEINPASREVQAAPELQPIALRSMFWRAAWLEPSAWMEHVPFAFWLVEAHRPKVIVELGTHHGTSYFAFCQAVERLGLDARCFAVDTWKGDEHAGHYGEEVFRKVNEHNNAQYSGFSRLVRSSFDDARRHFTDGSVDLLHIDGLHTLEAVTHDFEAWSAKLSDRAIVVMHDTNVRERDFGVYRLFEKLRTQFPSFEFVHGHGLGILGVGPRQNQMMQQLFASSSREDAQWSIRDVFARLGRSCADAFTAQREQLRVRELTADIDLHKARLAKISEALDRARGEFESQASELAASRAKLAAQMEHQALERGQLGERINLLQEVRVELREQLVKAQEKLESTNAQVHSLAHPPITREAELAQAAALAELQQQRDRLASQLSQQEIAQRQIEQGAVLAKAQNDTLSLQLRQQQEMHELALASVTSELAQVRAREEESSKSLQDSAAQYNDTLLGLTAQIESAKLQNSQMLERHRVEMETITEARNRAELSVQARFSETAQLTKKLLELQHQLSEKENAFLDLQRQTTEQQRASDAAARQAALDSSERSLALQRVIDDLHVTNEATLEATLARQETLRQALQDELGDALNRIEALQQQISELHASRSWRLTAPLRRFRGSVPAIQSSPARPVPAVREEALAIAAPDEKPVDPAVETIRGSGLFDAQWYLLRYPDVAMAGIDPIEHYLYNGAQELRDPTPGFSTRAYLEAYPDVAQSEINPFLHYIEFGRAEGRGAVAGG